MFLFLGYFCWVKVVLDSGDEKLHIQKQLIQFDDDDDKIHERFYHRNNFDGCNALSLSLPFPRINCTHKHFAYENALSLL